MRLGDVLSKPPKGEFDQVDAFLVNRKGNIGQQVKLEIGQVALNYYCSRCEDNRTYLSQGEIQCIFVNERIISIDCVLNCNCGTSVQVWYLVESEEEITGLSPKVRILKKSEKLSSFVKIDSSHYGEFSDLLELAKRAYRERLGAGSIVYLRKVFEKLTVQAAQVAGIDYERYENGNPKNFSALLKKVDDKSNIIPREFSENGYRLFRELSNIVHGEYDEETGLKKFESLHRMVIGIIENIKNSRELQNAIQDLGWNNLESEVAQ